MIRKSWRWTLCSLAALIALPSRAIMTNGPAGSGATSDWDGVGELFTPFSPVTATLLDSTHILTSAHGIFNDSTGQPFTASSLTFTIGSTSVTGSSVAIPNGYSNSNPSALDIAVITLTSPVTGHMTYGYNTGQINEMSSQATLVGYGVGGDGTNGENSSLYPFGTKRAGVNVIDVNTDNTSYNPGTGTLPRGLLVFDFDNYAAGTNGPLGGPAVGVNEADTTDGDSGGPMFQLDSTGHYLITGVTSNGLDDNPMFNDVGWETRVSDYASFIEQFVPAPEPVSLAPICVGIGVLCSRRRRK